MRVFKMDELGLGYYREGSAPPAAAAVVNEEIDIDDDEDDGAQIQQVAVPAAVFGAAGMDVVASEAGNGMGALERFKRAQGLCAYSAVAADRRCGDDLPRDQGNSMKFLGRGIFVLRAKRTARVRRVPSRGIHPLLGAHILLIITRGNAQFLLSGILFKLHSQSVWFNSTPKRPAEY
jgi:hypothetical protein